MQLQNRFFWNTYNYKLQVVERLATQVVKAPATFKNAGKATPLTTQIANKPDPALPQSSSSAPTFCQFFLWYKHDEVHEIMRDDVQKKDYTLELHIEMKTNV